MDGLARQALDLAAALQKTREVAVSNGRDDLLPRISAAEKEVSEILQVFFRSPRDLPKPKRTNGEL